MMFCVKYKILDLALALNSLMLKEIAFLVT